MTDAPRLQDWELLQMFPDPPMQPCIDLLLFISFVKLWLYRLYRDPNTPKVGIKLSKKHFLNNYFWPPIASPIVDRGI